MRQEEKSLICLIPMERRCGLKNRNGVIVMFPYNVYKSIRTQKETLSDPIGFYSRRDQAYGYIRVGIPRTKTVYNLKGKVFGRENI